MATEPQDQSRSTGVGGGCGGKIPTNRRRWRFNPYDRPPPPPPESPLQSKSPNWLSSVVPASRKIATGAVKILSSILISDSSSSDSSADEESVSDDDDNNDIDRDGHLNEGIGSNSEAERKHLIKQLVLQETFSREECDMLVKIIHSRVLEHSSEDRGEMIDSTLIPGRSILNVTPDHAVMEAKKFLEEKKAGRSPQSDFGHGSSGLYSATIQHIESEAGSPADMARSYMQARPPWASASTGQFELRTPSTVLTQLTSKEKLHSVRELSVTHLKERKYSGAWNMQDEIRRLRSKATEDMLRPLSSNFVPSLPSPLPRSSQELVTVAIPGDKVNSFSSVETKTLNRSAKLAAGADSNKGISASDIREGITIEASLPSQATFAQEQKQDLEANQNVPERTVSDHAAELADPNFRSRNGPKGVEYKWELSSEVSIEVPTAHDTANVESGSQHSHEELSQEQSETEGKHGVAVKPDGTGMNQQGKKPVRRQPKRLKKAA